MADPVYLDEQGNPLPPKGAPGPKVYLDENGEPQQPKQAAQDEYTPLSDRPDKAGAATSFAQTSGVDPDRGFVNTLKDWGTGLKQAVTHPIDSAEMIGEGMQEGQKQEFQKAFEQSDKGNPVNAAAHVAYGYLPLVGPSLGRGATQMEQGNYAGGLGTTAAVAVGLLGAPEGRANLSAAAREAPAVVTKFAKAESNPHKLYNSYLGPVADKPHPVPDAPPVVLRAVVRDMEAAGDGEAAGRLKSGNATIGDLDQARQRANRLASSIYRSPGNYSPGLAEGAEKFAGKIRDEIYPQIEEAHGLPQGSLRGVKQLQGDAMAAERHPTLAKRFIRDSLGAGAGAYVGHKLAGGPGGLIGAGVGARLAEPVATGVDEGMIGLRTKRLGLKLPPPRR